MLKAGDNALYIPSGDVVIVTKVGAVTYGILRDNGFESTVPYEDLAELDGSSIVGICGQHIKIPYYNDCRHVCVVDSKDEIVSIVITKDQARSLTEILSCNLDDTVAKSIFLALKAHLAQ